MIDKIKNWFKKDEVKEKVKIIPLKDLMNFVGYEKALLDSLGEDFVENLYARLLCKKYELENVVILQKTNSSVLGFQIAYLLGIKKIKLINFQDPKSIAYSKVSKIEVTKEDQGVMVYQIKEETIPNFNRVTISLQSEYLKSDFTVCDLKIDQIPEVSLLIKNGAEKVLAYKRDDSLFGLSRNGLSILEKPKKGKSRVKKYGPEEIIALVTNPKVPINFSHVLSGLDLINENLDKMDSIKELAGKFSAQQVSEMKLKLKEIKQVLDSMSLKERNNPKLLNLNSSDNSRLDRISRGAGVEKHKVLEILRRINTLLQQVRTNPQMLQSLLANVSNMDLTNLK